MAQPPIIISNQGLFEQLARGCTGKDDIRDVITQMKLNLGILNEKARNDAPDRPILRRIESSSKKQDARYLWCLANETTQALKGKFREWDYIIDNNAELSG